MSQPRGAEETVWRPMERAPQTPMRQQKLVCRSMHQCRASTCTVRHCSTVAAPQWQAQSGDGRWTSGHFDNWEERGVLGNREKELIIALVLRK